MTTRGKTRNNQASKKGKSSPSSTKGGKKGGSAPSRKKLPRLIEANPPLRSERTGHWT